MLGLSLVIALSACTMFGGSRMPDVQLKVDCADGTKINQPVPFLNLVR